MQQPNESLRYHPTLVKSVAALCVAGLHAAVIAALFLSSTTAPLQMEESGVIQFVEISEELIDTAPQDEPAEEVQEEIKEAEVPEPEPEIIEPDPEPEVVEPEPEPEVVEPEPEPEIIEPEPEEIPEEKVEDAISEPPVPPKPEPLPKPEPKPKPKPQPKPRPAPPPPPKPRPVQAPVAPSGASTEIAPPKAPQAKPDPAKPRLIGSVDYLGRRPVPVYPKASQRRGEKGRVVIRILISPNGLVENASVRTSSGYERLDQSALTAARKARFRPYTENGVAYPALADIPFDFVL